jgi:hypothetical protein
MLYKVARLPFFLLLWLTASTCVHSQDVEPPRFEVEHAEPKGLEIKSVRVFARPDGRKKKSYVGVQTFRETRPLHLSPSNRFDVKCDVVGGSDVLAGDYLLWTTVEFLVAPVIRAYDQMDDNQLASSVGWGQVTEMRDLTGTPIYFLRPSETQQVLVKGLNLSDVLSAFPIGDGDNLWPWLIRVTVHIQDRSGKQIAAAERTLRLAPNANRKTSRYNDPVPDR